MRSERGRFPSAQRGPNHCGALLFRLNPLYLKLAFRQNFSVRSGAQCYAQAHIPTEPPPSGEDTRLFDAHEDQSGSGSAFPPPRQGSQARFRECRLPRLAQLDSNCDVEYAPYPGFPVRSSRHVRVCGFLLRKAAGISQAQKTRQEFRVLGTYFAPVLPTFFFKRSPT